MKRLDSRELSIDKYEILGFSRIRNERIRLPWFLQYYRSLGIKRFFIVDNNSTDGSTEYLLTQNDVHLFHTSDSYAGANSGMDWLNHLLKTYAIGHWTVTGDADEIFIFPGFETVRLNCLVEFLDNHAFNSLKAPIVDMYSSKPIEDTHYQAGTDFLLTCPYFDDDAVSPDYRRSPRSRLFWDKPDLDVNPPYLLKIPLVKWQEDFFFERSTHIIKNTKVADISGILLHFKFFNDFFEKVSTAVEEKQYWQGSSQYAVYMSGIQNNPKVSAYYPGSLRFENSLQLVQLGLMQDSSDFIDFRQKTISYSQTKK